jgi:hypothetical protein
MKKMLCIGIVGLVAGTVSADVLVSWEGDSVQSPINNTLGVSGIAWASVHTGRGSDDGTYGSIGSGAATTAYSYTTRNDSSFASFRISNNSGQDLQLSEIVFDYLSIYLSGPQQIEVWYEYGQLDDANGTLLATIDTPGEFGWIPGGAMVTKDLPDYSAPLNSLLTDSILATGQFAQFKLQGAGASDGGVNGIVDNIAFTGTVIPEPATLGLISMVSGGLLFVRRRFCI